MYDNLVCTVYNIWFSSFLCNHSRIACHILWTLLSHLLTIYNTLSSMLHVKYEPNYA